MEYSTFTLAQAGNAQPAPADAGKNVTVIGMPNAPAPGNTGTTAASPGVPTATPTSSSAPNAPPNYLFPLLIVGMFAILIIPTFFSQRKEKKKREELMNSIRKGDKVLTLGGVIGHVVDLDGSEVILRVEDGRIRFAKSAVQQVLEAKSGATSNVEPKDKASKAELAGTSN